jgi:hypothetical protein
MKSTILWNVTPCSLLEVGTVFTFRPKNKLNKKICMRLTAATCHHILEDSSLHSQCLENLRSHTICVKFLMNKDDLKKFPFPSRTVSYLIYHTY